MYLQLVIQNTALRGGDPHYLRRLLVSNGASLRFTEAFVSFIQKEQSVLHSQECAKLYHDWQGQGEESTLVLLSLLGH